MKTTPCVKGIIRFLSGLQALAWPSLCAAAVINLDRPVAVSLNPDIIYYSFDDYSANPPPSQVTVPNLAQKDEEQQARLRPGSFSIPTLSDAGSKEGFGSSIRFSGGQKTSGSTQNSYLNILDTAEPLQFDSRSFTLGVWLKLDLILSKESKQQVVIFDKGTIDYKGTGAGGFSLYLESPAGDDNWQILLQTRNGSTLTTARSTSFNLAVSTWLHIGVSFDHESGLPVFWYNGEALAAEGSALLGAIGQTSRFAALGERTTSAYYSTFSGEMDDFFITSGVHSFAIPEPTTLVSGTLGALLIIACGKWAGCALRTRL